MNDGRMNVDSDSDDGGASLAQRLDEAMSIVPPIRAQRKKEEEEKRIKNTYREEIMLRQKQRIRYATVYHGDSSNDGEEYDPKVDKLTWDIKKVKSTANNNKSKGLKRKATNIGDGNHKRGKKVLGLNVLADSPYHPFMTVPITSPSGKRLLAELAKEHNTHINVWMTLDGNTNQTPDDGNGDQKKPSKLGFPWISLDDEDYDLRKPRSLRNGKVREPAPRIKRRTREEQDAIDKADGTYLEAKKADIPPSKRPRIERELTDREIFANLGKPLPPIPMPGDLKKTGPQRSSLDTGLRAQAISEPELIIGVTAAGSTPDTAIRIDDSASEAENQRRPVAPVEHPSTIEVGLSHRQHEDAGEIATIITAFAHPINFKCLVPCDFCSDYRFGIMGYGRIEVNVAYSPTDPAKMTELGDGHASNRPLTTMCFGCAAQRLMIIRCKCHKFESILPPGREAGDIDGPYITHLFGWEEVINGPMERSKDPPLLPPCSLCINAASWACCAYQTYNRILQPCRIPDIPLKDQMKQFKQGTTLSEPVKGCGLRLCDGCHRNLESIGFVMEDEDEVTEAITKDQDVTRADLEFLFANGALGQAYDL